MNWISGCLMLVGLAALDPHCDPWTQRSGPRPTWGRGLRPATFPFE